MSRKFDAPSMSGREWLIRTMASSIGLIVAMLGMLVSMASLFLTWQQYLDHVPMVKLYSGITAGVVVTAFGAPACGAWIMGKLLKIFGLKPLPVAS